MIYAWWALTVQLDVWRALRSGTLRLDNIGRGGGSRHGGTVGVASAVEQLAALREGGTKLSSRSVDLLALERVSYELLCFRLSYTWFVRSFVCYLVRSFVRSLLGPLVDSAPPLPLPVNTALAFFIYASHDAWSAFLPFALSWSIELGSFSSDTRCMRLLSLLRTRNRETERSTSQGGMSHVYVPVLSKSKSCRVYTRSFRWRHTVASSVTSEQTTAPELRTSSPIK